MHTAGVCIETNLLQHASVFTAISSSSGLLVVLVVLQEDLQTSACKHMNIQSPTGAGMHETPPVPGALNIYW